MFDSRFGDLVGCPECGHTAEITDEFDLSSTGGRLAHVKVRCITGHWFLGPRELLVPTLRAA